MTDHEPIRKLPPAEIRNQYAVDNPAALDTRTARTPTP